MFREAHYMGTRKKLFSKVWVTNESQGVHGKYLD